MFSVMPKATISIKTDSSTVNNNLDITLNTVTKELDASKAIVPATLQQSLKTSTQLVDATGELDKGAKAAGKVKIALTDCSQAQVTINAGTGVSANGLTFITQQAATISSVKIANQCKNANFPDISTATVDVVAQKAGEKYNLEAQNYTVAGVSGVTATGTAMVGGTSQIVKVVQQADIDAAKAKIAAADTNAVKQELKDKLISKGLYAITATLTTVAPDVQASASVGEEVANVTVTQKTTYTMLGVDEDDLKKVIADSVNKKIDTKKQQILDYGITKGVFAKQNDSPSGMLVALQVTSVVGTDLDITGLKAQVAGKKAGAAKDIIKEYPGVSDVDVKYSPFWVSSIPSKPGKIIIQVEEPKSE
jgi:hypothetical protein